MKAILLKEIRENTKWALLILIILGLLMAYGFGSAYAINFGLVADRMQMITLFGFSGAGLALGLLQILQDSRRGRWSFLIHRPIPRARIFLAKIIVGLSLYLISTGVPLALAAAWAAAPGRVVAPFEWHMILPRLADLVGGLMWYFAALLLACRPARWVGSRLAPLGLALLGSFAMQELAINFVEAILIAAAGILILWPAARSAFIHDGVFESQPRLIRLLQTLSTGAGIALALVFTLGVGDELLESVFAPRDNTVNTRYQIQQDGQVIRVTTGSTDAMTITDLQGNPLPSLTIKQVYSNQLSQDSVMLQDLGPNAPDRDVRQRYWGVQSQMAYLRFVGYDTVSVAWFYVVGRNTIEGFDRFSRRYVGSIGPDGFLPASQTPHAFLDPLSPEINMGTFGICASRTSAYQLDLPERGIQKIFASSTDDPIIGAQFCPDAASPYSNSYAAVVTHSTIHLLKDNKELFGLPLEHGFPPYQYVSFGRTTGGHFMLYYESFPMMNMAHQPPDWVTEADENGHILRRLELPKLPMHYDETPTWIEPLGVLAFPPGAAIPVSVIHPDRLMRIESIIVALASAGITIRLMRRFECTPAAAAIWTVANLLLGLFGILLLLCLREPVARRRCPGCGKPRLVSHENCEHCAQPFESPKPEGIEIFATV